MHSDAKSAVRALRFSAVDPHQVAERVAGMLAEAHRSRNPLAGAPVQVLRSSLSPMRQANDAASESSVRRAMTEQEPIEALGLAFDPGHQGAKVEKFWRDWGQRLGLAVTEREAEAFRAGLGGLPGYFYGKLNYYAAINPVLAKALLVKLGVVPKDSPAASDPDLKAALANKARDKYSAEDLQDYSKGLIENYEFHAKNFFPDNFKPLSESERRDWHQKIGDLPAVVVEGMSAGGLQGANFLVLAHRLGLSKLGAPECDEIPME
jgi:hypothetical protein